MGGQAIFLIPRTERFVHFLHGWTVFGLVWPRFQVHGCAVLGAKQSFRTKDVSVLLLSSCLIACCLFSLFIVHECGWCEFLGRARRCAPLDRREKEHEYNTLLRQELAALKQKLDEIDPQDVVGSDNLAGNIAQYEEWIKESNLFIEQSKARSQHNAMVHRQPKSRR